MGLEMKYFGLRPRAKHRDDAFASAAQSAMFQFADSIEGTDADLAKSLRTWARQEITKQAHMKEDS